MTIDRAAVAELIYRYAELIDEGDFAGLGTLLAGAVVTFEGNDREYRGADTVRRLYEHSTRRYPDGTPKTKHVMTNVIVTEGDGGREGTAASRSYYTVFQAVPGELALQPIIAGRYRHRFERSDGEWHITGFHVIVDLLGDLGAHLLFELS
ncbi:MAG TPA: nuclear transport factor 2 family protein [Acidimicrobiales bacterium]|jgi:3-phenylpropionate/cinnamic acid dioxygenase small subunit|nr:nuclear transport factor 2 family protein [Acidimicrobiales bacterium]